MCKFTYLGYRGCEEPDRHYFIRREKCSAKAHLKHWCAPHEQEEAALTGDEDIMSLPCPMCADVPIVFDQPLLEIAHSRRSVLPAPYYDAATGKYSRNPRHHAHNQSISKEVPAPLVPKPLNMARVQFDRSASESAVNRIKQRERLAEYKLPATTYNPSEQDFLLLPATSYQPSAQGDKLPKPLPMPQPMTITPPSSREGSLSPPQSRMNGVIRTLPPGESNRRELDSLRERAKAAAAKDNTRPSTPSSRPGTDRSRSGSESSTSSFGNSVPPPPPPPRRTPSRKPSVASSTASSTTATSSTPSQSSSVSSRNERRPEHRRKESTSTNASSSTSTSRSPPSEATSDSSFADRVKDSALRSIGFGGDRNDRTASPERGRRLYRRDRLGSSSERSDSPSIWRPTISPPQLQQDSLGMARNGEIVQSFKQRLVPFAPSSKASKPSTTPSGEEAVVKSESAAEKFQPQPQPRPKTPHPNAEDKPAALLRLYPSKAEDEKIAMAAFSKMFQEEQKALMTARQELPADVPKRAAQGATATEAKEAKDASDSRKMGQSDSQKSHTDPISLADVARSMGKVLPAAPTGLRRIKTGQVKTVTVAPPRPPKRANTSDVVVVAAGGGGAAAATPAAVKVKTGPLFRFATVGGGAKAQEFEIVSGGPDGAGHVF